MTPINIGNALIVCADAFVITAAIGPSVNRYLRKMKFGQKICFVQCVFLYGM